MREHGKTLACFRQLKEIFRCSRSQPVKGLIEAINPVLCARLLESVFLVSPRLGRGCATDKLQDRRRSVWLCRSNSKSPLRVLREANQPNLHKERDAAHLSRLIRAGTLAFRFFTGPWLDDRKMRL